MGTGINSRINEWGEHNYVHSKIAKKFFFHIFCHLIIVLKMLNLRFRHSAPWNFQNPKHHLFGLSGSITRNITVIK